MKTKILIIAALAMAVLVLPAVITEQNGISTGAPGDIPVSDQYDLARVGTGVVYGGYTWSLSATYSLTNNIIITDNLNGGVQMNIQTSLSGTTLTITVTSSEATVTSLTAQIDAGMGSSASGGAVTIAGVTPGEHHLIVGGTTTGGNYAWSTVYDPSVPMNTTFDSNGNFTPIGTDSPFTGTFKGNGKAVYGLNTAVYDPSGAAYSGLFARTSGANIQSIGTLLDRNGSGKSIAMSQTLAYAGGIVGLAINSNVTQGFNSCTVNATVNAPSTGNLAHAGGIVGADIGSTGTSSINLSWNCGTVVAMNANGDKVNAGGIIGTSTYTTIYGCHNNGVVHASSDVYSTFNLVCAGGIAGQVNPLISTLAVSYSYNAAGGNISGEGNGCDVRVGGIVGFFNTQNSPMPSSNSYKIYSCYNLGPLSDTFFRGEGAGNGSTQIGGIVGEVTGGNTTYANRTVFVQECFNTGSIEASSAHNVFAGGLVGEVNFAILEILNCYNAGDITAAVIGTTGNFCDVGGLLGSATGTATVTMSTSYNKGKISENGTNTAGHPLNIGGLVGEGGGTMSVRVCHFLEHQMYRNGALIPDVINGGGTVNLESPLVPVNQRSGAKTAAQMTPLSSAVPSNTTTYIIISLPSGSSGWNFDNTWKITDGTDGKTVLNDGYPILRGFEPFTALMPNNNNPAMNIFFDSLYKEGLDKQYAQYQPSEGQATFWIMWGLIGSQGAQTINFQWQSSSDGGSTWKEVPGAIGDAYALGPLVGSDSGSLYRVVLTPPGFSVPLISDPCTLYVLATVAVEGTGLSVDTGFVPQGGTISDPNKAVYGQTASAVISADPGIDLPTDVIVTMGGTQLAKGAGMDFTYDPMTGEVDLLIPVDGDIVITTLYSVTYGLYGGTGTIDAEVGGVDIGPSPASVEDGVAVEFTATPDPGWLVKEWYVNGTAVGSSSATFSYTIASSDVSVQVLFEQTFTLTYGVFDGSGTVGAAVGGADAGPSPAIVFDSATVRFSATPDPGWRIKDWHINGSAVGSTSATFTYTIAGSDATVQAEFEMIPNTVPKTKDYYITATSDPGATITASGVVIVPKGCDRTFVFAAKDGFSITDVRIDGLFSLSHEERVLGQYTFCDIMENHTIEVKTTIGSRAGITLTIDVMEGEGFAMYDIGSGSVVFSRTVDIQPGTSLTIRAIAGHGYVFDRWETPNIETVPTISVNDIRESAHIELYFKAYKGPSDDGALWWIAALLIFAGILLLWFLLRISTGLFLKIKMGVAIEDASVTFKIEKKGKKTKDVKKTNKKGVCRIPAKKGSTVSITRAVKDGSEADGLPFVIKMEKWIEHRELNLK